MNYRSRWYDPSIGRFISPDSIIPDGNPQSLNRYSYVNNNPINYSDPTGHYPASDCNSLPPSAKANCLAGATPDWMDLSNNGIYSPWELQSLVEIYYRGGAQGMKSVRYIINNSIHITVGELTDPQSFMDIEAWFDEGNNAVVLNARKGYKVGEKVGDWGLQTIAHEAKHIEQGNELSHSKIGEMEAWKYGLEIYKALDPSEFLPGSDYHA